MEFVMVETFTLDQMFDVIPTHVDKEATLLLMDIKAKEDWFLYGHKYPNVEQLAETYINNHAKIETALNTSYGISPLLVLRSIIQENMGDEGWQEAWFVGFVYDNGAVVRLNRNNGEVLTFLWVSQATRNHFEYP